MVDIELDVPAPLRDCLTYCEDECVLDCCGIAAVSTNPTLIAAWRDQAGPVAVAEARRQIAELTGVVQDRSRKVMSRRLNHYAHDEPSRRALLDFLAAIDAGLTAVGRR
ncbi:hypothetical protein Afil01_32020 [Actinorhabdospora filicis]|uniref:Uncharacterized protein n=1 Tax=Actinorhabdospora filicis TaxID=1785913 RepID=A0A9W6WB64_9ACTN|nr:DUF6331 family protein [Actinorhabdospora filicis]GLZ78395.1 hypothetical protein Afil01_32020 [Actinorhabdospora filicis]